MYTPVNFVAVKGRKTKLRNKFPSHILYMRRLGEVGSILLNLFPLPRGGDHFL